MASICPCDYLVSPKKAGLPSLFDDKSKLKHLAKIYYLRKIPSPSTALCKAFLRIMM